jgi:hypothetical protein
MNQATIITLDSKRDKKALASLKGMKWIRARIRYARIVRLKPVVKYRFGIEKP